MIFPRDKPPTAAQIRRAHRAKIRASAKPPVFDLGFIRDTTDASFPILKTADTEQLTIWERRTLEELLTEKARRRQSTLKAYKPWDVPAEFHKCSAPVRLCRGSNRAGKTLAVAVELARAWTNQDPYNKYPKTGRSIVVGKDLLHCSKVIFRKIFRPGAMKVFRHPDTRIWTPYIPDQHGIYADLVKEAPPLITERWYSEKDISWEDKKEEVPRSIKLKTGWEVTFFSGEGAPPQGWDVDLIEFDEEIPHPRWYPEMVPRLVDRGGRFMWSFTAQAATVVAYELGRRARDEAEHSDSPRVVEFFMKIDDNPYISEKAKSEFKADLQFDEEELRVRYYGEYAIEGHLVYGTFNRTGPHKIEPFEIPENWTRDVAIDPGRQVSAALFRATPPPGDPEFDRPIIYGEQYSRKTDAKRVAREMKGFLGESWITNWVIDHKYGQQVQAAGESVEEVYAREFREAGLEENGFKGFIWANPDIASGKIAVKALLQYRDGAPGLLFMIARIPWFCWEIGQYVDRRITRGGGVIDDVSHSNVKNHLMDCLRYLAQFKAVWKPQPPRIITPKRSWALDAIDKKRERARTAQGWGRSINLS